MPVAPESTAAPGAAHLLVVGDRASPAAGSGRRSRGPACRSPSRARPSRRAPSSRRRSARPRGASRSCGRERRVVGAGVDAARAEPGGDPLRVGDGQAVDDAAAGQVRQVLRRATRAARPGRRARSPRAGATPRASGPRTIRDAARRAARRRRRRPGRWRSPSSRGPGRRRREAAQDPPDPPVVGPEVVAPVARCSAPRRRRTARSSPGSRAGSGSRRPRCRGARARSAGRRSSSAARPASTSSHSAVLPELIVAARRPSRPAIAIWLRMSASSGLMISVGPWPSSRRTRVAIQ